jgi:hypothetical protein
VSERQSRPVDYGSADDGLLEEEAPDLGPLQEAAEAAELAEAMSGLTAGSGGPLPARDPLRPLACAVARALTDAGAVRLWRGAYRDGGAADGQPITECSAPGRPRPRSTGGGRARPSLSSTR